MSITPGYFLLVIIVGGIIFILTTLSIYLSGCVQRVMEMFKSKTPPEMPHMDDSNKSGTPTAIMRPRLRSSIGGPPRPIGTGYYTSSPFWSAPPPPVALPFDALSFEQAFPPPEWMSGYLFGLQAALTDHLAGEEQSSSVFYSGTLDPNDLHIQMQPQYSHEQLNIGNPAFMVHLSGTLDCDEDLCADAQNDHDQGHHVGIDFGDGGASAAGF